jgi:hypothetical protein
MSAEIAIYAGSIIATVWGIARIVPTRDVVQGFGAISQDNRLFITMEWMAEGLALIFIGGLVLLVTIAGGHRTPAFLPLSGLVYGLSALMLFVMAGLTALTVASSSLLPIKICPFVKTACALLIFLGSIL